tara:strand:+ start:863 stop:1291 length:429 start_codon:yes stop_codon:yes gene_type:complete
MANFALPPIKEASSSIPSLSKAELSALPSTTLVALSNNMAVAKSEASMKASQLKARAKKLTGEASINIPGKGRNSIATSQSLNKVKASMESTIGPVTSTAGLMNESSAVGADILKNASAAGTTELDAASVASKLGSFSTEIL